MQGELICPQTNYQSDQYRLSTDHQLKLEVSFYLPIFYSLLFQFLLKVSFVSRALTSTGTGNMIIESQISLEMPTNLAVTLVSLLRCDVGPGQEIDLISVM